MTRRKPFNKLRKVQPPNPANIERKLRRIRIEIQSIADAIDDYLVACSTTKLKEEPITE